MATNYFDDTYLLPMFGGFGEQTTGALNPFQENPALSLFPSTPPADMSSPMDASRFGALQPMTPATPASPRRITPMQPKSGLYDSLNKPMFGEGSMNVGTFAQLAGMAAHALEPNSFGGRLGASVANFASHQQDRSEAFDERRQEKARLEQHWQAEHRSKQMNTGLNMAGNPKFGPLTQQRGLDMFRQAWNADNPEMPLPDSIRINEASTNFAKQVKEINAAGFSEEDRKRAIAEAAVSNGIIPPEKYAEWLFKEKDRKLGKVGWNASTNRNELMYEDGTFSGIEPERSQAGGWTANMKDGRVIRFDKYGNKVQELQSGPPLQAPEKGPKAPTIQQTLQVMQSLEKVKTGERAPSIFDHQMAAKIGMALKPIKTKGLLGGIKTTYDIIPVESGFTSTGRLNTNGQMVFQSPDGKSAWVAE